MCDNAGEGEKLDFWRDFLFFFFFLSFLSDFSFSRGLEGSLKAEIVK